MTITLKEAQRRRVTRRRYGTAADAKAARNAAQRARVAAVRGKYAHLSGTVDEFLRERHEEAVREMERDLAADASYAARLEAERLEEAA